MSDTVELKSNGIGFTANVIHSLKWWQKAINFFYKVYKVSTPLDNLEPSDFSIIDQDGKEVNPKSLTWDIDNNNYYIEANLTSGSVSICTGKIVRKYKSTITKTKLK